MDAAERSARYSDLFSSGPPHPSDCAFCPICAGISVLRSARPEAFDHLASAMRELIAAAGVLLDDAAAHLAPPTDAEPAAAPEDNVRPMKLA